MQIVIPSLSQVPPKVAMAMDELVAPLQVFFGRLGVWTEFLPTDLSPVNCGILENFTVSTTPGFFNVTTIGHTTIVSFNVGIGLAATADHVGFVFPWAVVGRGHNLAYDSAGRSLSVTLGTAEGILGRTAARAIVRGGPSAGRAYRRVRPRRARSGQYHCASRTPAQGT